MRLLGRTVIILLLYTEEGNTAQLYENGHKPLVILVMDLVLNQPTFHGMAQWWWLLLRLRFFNH